MAPWFPCISYTAGYMHTCTYRRSPDCPDCPETVVTSKQMIIPVAVTESIICYNNYTQKLTLHLCILYIHGYSYITGAYKLC